MSGRSVPEFASPDYRSGWHEMIQETIDTLTGLADEATAALQDV